MPYAPSMIMANKAVFLDRDGTLVEEVGYLSHIEQFKLLPRVGEAVRLLNQHKLKTIVVTNQSGVARGYFPESFVHSIHRKMQNLLKMEEAHLDGIYYCPHHPDEKCECRKPGTGLVKKAVEDLDLDCSKSYMVGDRGIDIELAYLVGAKGILVLTGYGEGEWEEFGKGWKAKPSYVAPGLYEAVQWILCQESLE
jgi:D-glycero-D-manno-heptose 1,7-bisphosphate phosphatase